MPARPRLICLATALALAGCAAPDAAAPHGRVRGAPPALIPTDLFRAPSARAAAQAGELAASTDALAARAAALRLRGAALSGGGVLEPEPRARLEAARPR